MELSTNYDESSVYRSISWSQSSDKDRMYSLGQRITSYVHDDGSRSYAYIYRISDTSYMVENIHFIRRFSISIINMAQEVVTWYEVENPINLTTLRNYKNVTKK